MSNLPFAAQVVGTVASIGFFLGSLWALLARKPIRFWPQWSAGKAGVPISQWSTRFGAVFAAGLVGLFLPTSDPWIRFIGISVALFGIIAGTISFARDVTEQRGDRDSRAN